MEKRYPVIMKGAQYVLNGETVTLYEIVKPRGHSEYRYHFQSGAHIVASHDKSELQDLAELGKFTEA